MPFALIYYLQLTDPWSGKEYQQWSIVDYSVTILWYWRVDLSSYRTPPTTSKFSGRSAPERRLSILESRQTRTGFCAFVIYNCHSESYQTIQYVAISMSAMIVSKTEIQQQNKRCYRYVVYNGTTAFWCIDDDRIVKSYESMDQGLLTLSCQIRVYVSTNKFRLALCLLTIMTDRIRRYSDALCSVSGLTRSYWVKVCSCSVWVSDQQVIVTITKYFLVESSYNSVQRWNKLFDQKTRNWKNKPFCFVIILLTFLIIQFA